jgi:hypothetical protein
MAPASRRFVLAAVAAAITLGRTNVLPAQATTASARFVWRPERSPAGPVVILVNLTDQVARVYRDGIEIGETAVSSGRPGHTTPTGVFTILQKDAHHHSSEYNDASMPFTERLTWGGVALHAGELPGYPSSHGCVHLPLAFARDLFGVATIGTTVVISDDHTAPEDLVHPGLVLPTTEIADAAPGSFVWQPERAPAGPMALLLSGADRRLYAYRNGIEIGVVEVAIARPEEPVRPAVFVLRAATSGQPDPARSGQRQPVWTQIGLGRPAERSDILDRLTVPPAFAAPLRQQMMPGTTLYATPAPAGPAYRTGPGFTVMATQAAA